MASSSRSQSDPNAITPYRMHVSQKYLDLTRQKLELTRIPRDPNTRQQRWEYGTSKSDVEPLVDHWVESYDWRAQETYYNDTLPQYRVLIGQCRMHFVHRRSRNPNAVPLLFCHGWPGSFIEVAQVIESLCDPIATPPRGDDNVQAFHVVCPSIPGFAFSDAVAEEGNNAHGTAEGFHLLMKRLGYSRYFVHGSDWGFKVGRMLALHHNDSCVALHTINPEVPAPRFDLHFLAWIKYRMAKLTFAVLHRSSFGYTPEELAMTGLSIQASSQQQHTPPLSPGSAPNAASIPARPQTSSYALTDSPAGLLAYIVDAIKPARPSSTSPPPMQSNSLQLANIRAPWNPTSLITWAMIYWLPGPEVSLRWLLNSSHLTTALWSTYSNVPLGISHFRDPQPNGSGTGVCPPQWAEAYQRVVMLRRRDGRVRLPAWERPAEVVLDIRDLCAVIGRDAFRAPESQEIDVD